MFLKYFQWFARRYIWSLTVELVFAHASGASGDDSVARKLLFLLEFNGSSKVFCILYTPLWKTTFFVFLFWYHKNHPFDDLGSQMTYATHKLCANYAHNNWWAPRLACQNMGGQGLGRWYKRWRNHIKTNINMTKMFLQGHSHVPFLRQESNCFLCAN